MSRYSNSDQLRKVVIRYDPERKVFTLLSDGKVVGEGDSGRRLGRAAWESGNVDSVTYDYDLTIDH